MAFAGPVFPSVLHPAFIRPSSPFLYIILLHYTVRSSLPHPSPTFPFVFFPLPTGLGRSFRMDFHTSRYSFLRLPSDLAPTHVGPN